MPLPPSGGWPISPEEAAWHTVARAVRGANPQDSVVKPPPPQVAPEAPVVPAVAKAMVSIAKLGPIKLEKKRQDTLKHWAKRKVELAQQEEELKKELDPEVSRVIQPKAILLFSEMLQSIHYDDMAVVELLTTGIKVL